jgi:spore cortex biosynthesis protein YabQ
MHPPVDVQLWRLAVLFLMGIFCNILFHTYTAVRAAISPAKLTGHILDALVAVLVLISIAATVFVVNYGEIRLYIGIAIAMGFVVSNALVGDIVYNIVFRCAKSVIKIIARTKRFLNSAINTLNQKVWVPLSNMLKITPPANGDDT